MRKDPRLYVLHIMECAARIEEYLRVWKIATVNLPAATAAIAATLQPPDQLEREFSEGD